MGDSRAVKVLVPGLWVPTPSAWMKARLGGSVVPIIPPASDATAGLAPQNHWHLPQTAGLGLSS